MRSKMDAKESEEVIENEREIVSDLRVNAIRVFVQDMARATAFYSDILGLSAKSEGEDWVVFDLAGIHLVVETPAKEDFHGKALIGRFLGVSLTSPDILSTFDVLSEKGVAFLAPPAKQDWGGYLAHFYDPDRNIISLVS
jgi:predicted enzyme related to lactoylglutathione lyase